MMPDYFFHGYALLVGVGRCAYDPWSLPVTVRDMQALRAVLADPDLCGYPADHIRLLHDDGATRQAILDGLARLAEQVAADPDATAVVFYSGHGWREEGTGRYSLIPHDVAPFDLPGSALSAEDFTAALRKVQARRLLVFMDCCHAAGMATAKDAARAHGRAPLPAGFAPVALPKGVADALKQGAGRAVFSSSTGAQVSWVRPDGSLSLYTYHLIEALQGAGNRPGDTVVRLSDLMNYLGKAVPASARALGKEQTPFFDTATEDFPVALLRGGKGLSRVGEGNAFAHPSTGVQAIGSRSVAAGGDVSGSVIVTGDQNVVQQGKYNVSIGRAGGVTIGDQISPSAKKPVKGIPMIPVESSMVDSVGYDEGRRLLQVMFTSGQVYCYEGVPPEVFRDLLEAESKGRYMRAYIIDVYPYRRGPCRKT
jgi:hypothetical protein